MKALHLELMSFEEKTREFQFSEMSSVAAWTALDYWNTQKINNNYVGVSIHWESKDWIM